MMQLSFLGHCIELSSYDTKEWLAAALNACPVGHLWLGENPDEEVGFYLARILLDCTSHRSFGIGICSQGHGLVPTMLLWREARAVVIGFNSELVAVEIPSCAVKFRQGLGSYFYSFVEHGDPKPLIVQHEIGLLALSVDGEVLWQFSQDVITGIRVDGPHLHLRFMDSPPVVLELAAGTPVQC